MNEAMLPAGYLTKRVVPPPGWLTPGASHAVAVCSVADCVNDNLIAVQGLWLHNGFGLANAAATLGSADAVAGELFYFEAYSRELDSDGWAFDPAGWCPRLSLGSATVADDVKVPPADVLDRLGYDVVVSGDFLEHSPLSCNGMAATLDVNEYCLFDRLDDAIEAIESGAFEGCEDGRYGIYAVHRCRFSRA